jgi:hypothetical protein
MAPLLGRRARELFDALDDDGNGVLTEEEFVQVTKDDVKIIKDRTKCRLH